ncbi:MAG: hypothetical protein ABIT83_19410 [Massilia sp.]
MSPQNTYPLALLLAAASVSAAVPAPRIGEAEVRESVGANPCFTISEKEERRGGAPNFKSVTVSETGKGHKPLWTMAIPAERSFPVLYSMCIPYAGRVQALPKTPAATLDAGKVYEVRIDAVERGPEAPRLYSARFCLAKQRDGAIIVHHIDAGAHEGRHLYGCIVPK